MEDTLKQISDRIDSINKDNYVEDNLANEIALKLKEYNNYEEEFYKKILEKLNNLIGLDEVKEEINKLIDYLIFLRKINNKINVDNLNLNMIFRGNPGTGKTTVARIVAEILCNLGYLSSPKVIETTPRDFIGEYVGHTAVKAKKLIDSAQGGLIFIDEAYTFAKSNNSNHSFVPEAITEIIKEMESKKTVFIFAGYSKEMFDFIDLNPGIKSRIGYDIEFKDYTSEELLSIFDKKLESTGLKITEDARELLILYIEDKAKNKNFGNGRMVDNLFDQIIREHASLNNKETDLSKLLLITKDTVEKLI